MENEIQKFMSDSKHEFAKTCNCERCKEIVMENEAEFRKNQVSLLIDEWAKKYPDRPKDSRDWTFDQSKFAIETFQKIRELYDKYPITEKEA